MPPGPGSNKTHGGHSGLKILWIPGRKKKHEEKGVFRPTKHDVEHKHADRRNEPWSLGSTKSQDGNASDDDKNDKIDLINPSSPTCTVLPTASLGVATVDVDGDSDSEPEIKLEKCVIKDIQYIKYNIRDSLQSLTSSKDRISTQSTGDGDEKRSAGRQITKTDFDSIDRLDDVLDGQPKLQHQNGKSKSKLKNDKPKGEKTVNCLYYTMMCCECIIS